MTRPASVTAVTLFRQSVTVQPLRPLQPGHVAKALVTALWARPAREALHPLQPLRPPHPAAARRSLLADHFVGNSGC